MRQQSFGFLNNFKKEFGGSLLLGKRKTARPLAVKSPMHLVLKTTKLKPFNATNRKLENIVRSHTNRFKIKIYNFSLNNSHIHMVLRLPTRAAYFAFIKTVTAALISYLSKALGKDLRGLFDLRPYTKIIICKKQFENALDYMELNQQEALGLIVRTKISSKKEIRSLKISR